MNGKHPVERLFERLKHFGYYPSGVLPVPQRIVETAFFPGGAGLWGAMSGGPLPPAPIGGVMILGHNFDSEAGFNASLVRRGENLRGATWRNLLRLLQEAGISPETCFFTNAYMGLMAGNKAVGVFPGSRDADFVRRCQDFLLEQLRVMQPKVVLTLGKEVIPVLAPLSPDVESVWSGATGLGDLDKHDVALVYPVQFRTVPHPVAIAALTHPALRHLNIPRRRYKDLDGHAAEVAIVKDAMDLAKPSVIPSLSGSVI